MNRIIRVEIRNSKNQTKTFDSDGSSNQYRISFDVKKNSGSSNDLNLVTINNPSRGLIHELCTYEYGRKIDLWVGHNTDEKLSLLCSGYILQCIPNKSYTETSIQIHFYSNWYAKFDAEVSFTVEAKSPLKKHVSLLAQYFKNIDNSIVIDEDNIKVSEQVIEESSSYRGKVRDNLDSLAKQYAFTWNIQDGTFFAGPDNSARSGSKIHKASIIKGNLLSCSPSYFEFSQSISAMNIEMLLNPNIQPGDWVDLESGFYEQANGKYLVVNAQFVGSTYTADWKTVIESTMPPMKEKK